MVPTFEIRLKGYSSRVCRRWVPDLNSVQGLSVDICLLLSSQNKIQDFVTNEKNPHVCTIFTFDLHFRVGTSPAVLQDTRL